MSVFKKILVKLICGHGCVYIDYCDYGCINVSSFCVHVFVCVGMCLHLCTYICVCCSLSLSLSLCFASGRLLSVCDIRLIVVLLALAVDSFNLPASSPLPFLLSSRVFYSCFALQPFILFLSFSQVSRTIGDGA